MRPQNLSYYVEVYAAVERIVLRSGCGAATVRAVAAEGGLSASTVRYYYRNQSHLLACAFAAVDDHFSHELGRHPFAPGRLGRGDKPRVEDAVDVLAVHLPTDGAGLERLRLLHAYKAWGQARLGHGGHGRALRPTTARPVPPGACGPGPADRARRCARRGSCARS